MAKIAVDLQQALRRRERDGSSGQAAARPIAAGNGWSVDDVICTSGPRDRSFEEQHACLRIAMVVAGTFQYRSAAGSELMTPGSILLANPGDCFECGHRHGAGDRCISFGYEAGFFARIASDAGGRALFRAARLPAVSETAPFIASACAGVVTGDASWEALAIKIAARAVQLAEGVAPRASSPEGAVARVARIVRAIENNPEGDLSVNALARMAGLSPYHFLRTFERLTALTPHRFVLRTRLREAALRLADSRDRVVDVAFDCGFGDVSNFNRSFRAEFGVAPLHWRRSR